ncbi:MAG: hypothetical protein J0L67_18340 [Cytophagales bacterium]|nr:hypothetical protein [Cytophagales bacterium]
MTRIFLLLLLWSAACKPQPGDTASLQEAIPADSIEVIALKTGTNFRFKGLAVADDGSFFLGSWDKKEIVKVHPQQSDYEVLQTRYSGKLNGMGCYLRDGILYALMNEVNDDPAARPVSVLLLFDSKSLKLLKSYESHGVAGRNHFNQVVVNSKGVAYISNTIRSSVFVVDTRNPSDSLKQLIQHADLSWVHGLDLSTDEQTLFTTAYDGGIKFLNLQTLTFSPYRDTTLAGDDGLKYYKGALYGVGSNEIKKYTLDKNEQAVTKEEVILKDHPFFNDARCLQAKDGYLYCLANIEFEPVDFNSVNKTQALTDTYVIKLKLE